MGNTNSGRGGLPRAKRREVERLLRGGLMKKAQIARECGVDVTTVRRYQQQAAAGGGSNVEGAADAQQATVRCGGCGGLVLVSVGHCIACLQTKTIFEHQRQARIALNRRRSQKARLAA